MTIKPFYKLISMLSTFLLFFSVKAQENENGKQVKDTLTLKSDLRFVVDDNIQLEYVSGMSKIFDFVFVSPFAFVTLGLKQGSNWVKHTLQIKKIA
ncbi:MAG: hypothetical protein JSS98_09400 [Bacteroidetes bacterium]|nr:hypothetical protein [Bacteroidota bacterium]MBS1736799.1 hypothetical protein [Bacteroidota bacterium]